MVEEGIYDLKGWSQKADLDTWVNFEGGERKSYEGTYGKRLLGRRNSKCKGPEVATYLVCSMIIKEAREAGEW